MAVSWSHRERCSHSGVEYWQPAQAASRGPASGEVGGPELGALDYKQEKRPGPRVSEEKGDVQPTTFAWIGCNS